MPLVGCPRYDNNVETPGVIGNVGPQCRRHQATYLKHELTTFEWPQHPCVDQIVPLTDGRYDWSIRGISAVFKCGRDSGTRFLNQLPGVLPFSGPRKPHKPPDIPGNLLLCTTGRGLPDGLSIPDHSFLEGAI